LNLTDYQAKYFAHELTRRFPPDSVEKVTVAFAGAQVDLNPHQIDAALFAFKSPLSRGALLADEVGLGKTIEAGLVLSQKWAERKRRILIITPASLRKQWYQELTEKFFLPCRLLESKTYNAAVKQGEVRPFEAPEITICSYHFAKGKADAVERQEQGLMLTKKHEEALSEIIYFDENEVEEIHYIDEMARPSESWHVIVNKIAENLVVSQFKTYDIHCAAITEGWDKLSEVIEAYGDALSLPDGISKPIDVVPKKTRHKLWIQSCFSELEGIGQDKAITLKDEEQIDRIDDFIDSLIDCKDSVEYLHLSLSKIMTIVMLPTEDHKILIDAIMAKLKMPSPEHLLADYL
jgi:hypothetical protein